MRFGCSGGQSGDASVSGNEHGRSPQSLYHFARTAVYPHQTGANPEHINLAAYTVLKGELYLWILPFDLDCARTRVYFVQLGTPRDELLQILTPYDAPDVVVHAAGDYLGLNQRQSELVSNPLSNQDFKSIWGFFKRNLSSNLQDIESLLAQSGLSYEVIKDKGSVIERGCFARRPCHKNPDIDGVGGHKLPQGETADSAASWDW